MENSRKPLLILNNKSWRDNLVSPSILPMSMSSCILRSFLSLKNPSFSILVRPIARNKCSFHSTGDFRSPLDPMITEILKDKDCFSTKPLRFPEADLQLSNSSTSFREVSMKECEAFHIARRLEEMEGVAMKEGRPVFNAKDNVVTGIVSESFPLPLESVKELSEENVRPVRAPLLY